MSNMSATLQNGGAIPQLGVATRGKRTVLLSGALVATLLVLSTIVAHAHMQTMGPELKPFLPVCATIWAFAELITAFLLLSQFYVGGKVSFAVIAAGYAVMGLLTIPYLMFFPGIVSDAPLSRGDLGVSAWLWISWHLVFPIAIAAAHIIDGSLDSVAVPRNAIVSSLFATVGAVITASVAITCVVYFGRGWLPTIVLPGGHFTPTYNAAIVPFLVVVNAFALGIVLFRARRMSPLQMWLGIALLTMLLDGVLNIWAPGRYSLVWYVGKFQTLATSSAVLLMLLLEVATLYRRLYDVASIDTLTGLPNRRSFNDRVARALDDREEQTCGVALFVVDVDNFKSYNDRYGHAAGDTVLATVAEALNSSVVRSSDFVARFGGEEFVFFLPDILLYEAEKIAERARERVAKLAVIHDGSATSYLTVSVGVAFCSRHQQVGASTLFDFADQALYAAKEAGRNRVVIRHIGEHERERIAPTLVAVS
jgi:diguanylate cyclase (GGDEF)-like protein